MTSKIGDLIKWERLSGRSFAAFDAASEDDVVMLLYVTSGQDGSYTLDEYRRVYERSRHVMTSEVERMRRAGKVMAQFAAGVAPAGGTDDEAAGGDGSARLADAAYALIADGMDAEYLLERLPLWELRPLAEAFAARRQADDEKMKSAMTVWRLMAYWSVVPHVKRGAVKSPEALFRFPWEAEAGKVDGKKAIDEHGEEFMRLMSEGGGRWAELAAGKGKGKDKEKTKEEEDGKCQD